MLRMVFTLSLPLARYSQHRAATSTVLYTPRLVAARFESTNGGAHSTVRERQQYLQADWVAPKLTYEEVKKRTQEPTEVRLCFALRTMHTMSTSHPGRLFDRCARTRRDRTRLDSILRASSFIHIIELPPSEG